VKHGKGRRKAPGGAKRTLGIGLLIVGLAAAAGGVGFVLLNSGNGTDVASAGTTTSTTARPTTTTTEAPTTTLPPTTTTTAPPPPADGLRPGASGPDVLALQTKLDSLGYWVGDLDSNYAQLTQQAVMAFQKVAGLSRDGIAGPDTLAALATATTPTPVMVTDGIEISLQQQTLFIVQGGTVVRILNTSTGRSGWSTPPGDFTITRQVDGMRHAPLGDLYRPKYFNGGIAIHGSTSIPGQAASHGCARVSNGAINMLWDSGMAEIGTRVVVY
jgi:peptidoglycan hydrolase-like protein with peptidoglycan-binding domain